MAFSWSSYLSEKKKAKELANGTSFSDLSGALSDKVPEVEPTNEALDVPNPELVQNQDVTINNNQTLKSALNQFANSSGNIDSNIASQMILNNTANLSGSNVTGSGLTKVISSSQVANAVTGTNNTNNINNSNGVVNNNVDDMDLTTFATTGTIEDGESLQKFKMIEDGNTVEISNNEPEVFDMSYNEESSEDYLHIQRGFTGKFFRGNNLQAMKNNNKLDKSKFSEMPLSFTGDNGKDVTYNVNTYDGKVVVATATEERLAHCQTNNITANGKNVRQNGKHYFNLFDEITVDIDGKEYPAIVLDSSNDAMEYGKNIVNISCNYSNNFINKHIANAPNVTIKYN